MYGLGIIKGLGVTLKHFIDTYVEDFKYGIKRYTTDDGICLAPEPRHARGSSPCSTRKRRSPCQSGSALSRFWW